MDKFYNQYQILTDQLNLPEQNIPESLRVCNVSDQSDYNRLLDLFLKIFPDEIDSEKAVTLRELQEPEFEGVFLAKLDEEIVGFLVTGIINQVGYISYLGVLQEHRSKGVATTLLNRFKSYLQNNSIHKIRCKIRKDNKKTLGYINYLGFQFL